MVQNNKAFYRRLPLTLVACGATLLLSACAGQQNCDPSQTELFTGIACMSNGGYARRAAVLQNEAQTSQSMALLQREQAIKAQHNAALAQQRERSTSASMHKQITQLQSQANTERKEAMQLKKSKAQLLQQKAYQEAQLKLTEQKLATAKANPTPDDSEIQRINNKILELQSSHQTTLSDIAKSGG